MRNRYTSALLTLGAIHFAAASALGAQTYEYRSSVPTLTGSATLNINSSTSVSGCGTYVCAQVTAGGWRGASVGAFLTLDQVELSPLGIAQGYTIRGWDLSARGRFDVRDPNTGATGREDLSGIIPGIGPGGGSIFSVFADSDGVTLTDAFGGSARFNSTGRLHINGMGVDFNFLAVDYGAGLETVPVRVRLVENGSLVVTPEPATWTFLAMGAAGIGLVARRRRGTSARSVDGLGTGAARVSDAGAV